METPTINEQIQHCTGTIKTKTKNTQKINKYMRIKGEKETVRGDF